MRTRTYASTLKVIYLTPKYAAAADSGVAAAAVAVIPQMY